MVGDVLGKRLLLFCLSDLKMFFILFISSLFIYTSRLSSWRSYKALWTTLNFVIVYPDPNSAPNYGTTNSSNLSNSFSKLNFSEWAFKRSGTIFLIEVVLCPWCYYCRQTTQESWFLALTHWLYKQTAVTISPLWVSFLTQQNIIM